MRDVPDVAVAGVNLGGGGGDGHVVRGRVGQAVFARLEVPDAPRGDDREIRRERHVRQFEAHLIVALAGRAVTDRVGADLTQVQRRRAEKGAESARKMHLDAQGLSDDQKKILKQCSLPLTGKGVVNLIVTDLGVFDVGLPGLTLIEIAPGVTVDEIRAKTEPDFKVAFKH